MFKYIPIILLISSLVSCKHSTKQESKNNIFIDPAEQVAASDLFRGYRYVALETTDDNLIGKIDKVQIDSVRNRIYVMDRERGAVFVFNTHGKFIDKIQRPGRAPEEYTSLEDFVAYKSDIFCLARSGKINRYSETGDFLQGYKLDNWYNNFVILNDSLIYLYSENSNNKNFNFILYDYKNDVYLKEFDPFPKNQNYLFQKSPFNQVEDNLLITKPFDLTVYRLNENGMVPRYSFSFNTPDQIPEHYETMNTESLINDLRGKSLVKRLDNITKIGNTIWMVYEIFYPELGYRSLISSYDLDSKIVKTFRSGDEIDPQVPFLFNPLGFYKDRLVTYFPAIASLSIAKTYDLDIFKNDTIQETDNPILFFNQLK